jgi:hypothetical protein
MSIWTRNIDHYGLLCLSVWVKNASIIMGYCVCQCGPRMRLSLWVIVSVNVGQECVCHFELLCLSMLVKNVSVIMGYCVCQCGSRMCLSLWVLVSVNMGNGLKFIKCNDNYVNHIHAFIPVYRSFKQLIFSCSSLPHSTSLIVMQLHKKNSILNNT